MCGRFVIRLRLQRKRKQRLNFGADDGFLLFGFICLAVATSIKLRYIDQLFLAEALSFGVKDIYVPVDIIDQAVFMRKWLNSSNMLFWTAICCVKFSFMFFFRQIINRVRGRWITYWWIVFLVCVALTIYGSLIIFLPCPFYDAERSRKFTPAF